MSTPELLKLAEHLHEYSSNWLGLVHVMFPWGQAGTVLQDKDGPDEWQTQVLKTIDEGLDWNKALQIAVSSGHGVGKALSYDVEIPTPSGPRRWGDLAPGDKVFGQDGAPATIIQTHHFKSMPMYRVTFDDGSSCDVSSGHLWNVRGRQERRKKLDGWRTLETIELARLGVKRPNGTAMARQWEIPVQGAAEFDGREVKVHPYFMGVWLGDGTKGQPSYTKPDQEVADRLAFLGYRFGPVGDRGYRRALGVNHLFTDDVFRFGSHERYIPNDYKFNSIDSRMALFSGLCDTDGEVHHTGSIGYSSTSERLANDVVWLARSLGCKANIQPTVKVGKYWNRDGDLIECRDCWRITINAPFNPFTIARKKEAYKPSEHRYLVRWIDAIEEIAPKDGMCITVDRHDGLYLANDFVVTHNSALVSWIILCAMATCVNTRGVVTANTDNQLRTKTWVELSKWFELAPVLHPIFEMTLTALMARDPVRRSQWRFDRITWSEKNTEAFAGLHNQGRRIVVIYDEASAIPDIIWEVTEGAMTDEDTQILWLVCGNPTRSTGRFRQCWTKFKRLWKAYTVDSRAVKITNKRQIAEWLRAYGEDSDFFRVRVRGVFPRVGSMQFISDQMARDATLREAVCTIWDPLIFGVDVARFGDDKSVIAIRRGRDARTVPWHVFSGADTNTLALKIIELSQDLRPDAIFIDEGGIGAGVVDRLKFLKLPVIGVTFGSSPERNSAKKEGAVAYANKRAEMWGNMRDWLPGGAMPKDGDLHEEMCAIQYGYTMIHGQDCIQLEKKTDMKKRGVMSPNEADALALTFAYPVMPSDHTDQIRKKSQHQAAYDPYAQAWDQSYYDGGL